MATIPTQNAVPSEAPRDLKFNSGKIDEFVTSLEHEYKDRFGRSHLTIEGIKWMFDQLVERFKVDMNQAIIAAGYIPMDSFQQGAEITKRNEILRDETTGEYYRWDGDLPKSVPVGSTPESVGGVGVGKWVGVGDASLRSELSSENGASLIGTIGGRSLADKLTELVSVRDFGAKGDGVTDDTAAIKSAMDFVSGKGGGVVYIPSGTYILNTVTSKIYATDYSEGNWVTDKYGIRRPLAGMNSWSFFDSRNNITIIGDGPSSVLKSADGLVKLNSDYAGTKGVQFFTPENWDSEVVNFKICNLCIDHNGYNNKVAPLNWTNNQAGAQAVAIDYGDNIIIDSVLFKDAPGYQVIMLSHGVKNSTISNNKFTNCGWLKGENKNLADHSSIYIAGNDYSVLSNSIYQDEIGDVGAAIECHGRGVISGNRIKNYAGIINIGTDISGNTDVLMSNNTADGCGGGVGLYAVSQRSVKVKMMGNSLALNGRPPANFHLVGDFKQMIAATKDTISADGVSNVEIYAYNNTFKMETGTNWDGDDFLKGAFAILSQVKVADFNGNTIDGFKGALINLHPQMTGAIISFRNNNVIGCGTMVSSEYKYNTGFFSYTNGGRNDYGNVPSVFEILNNSFHGCSYGCVINSNNTVLGRSLMPSQVTMKGNVYSNYETLLYAASPIDNDNVRINIDDSFSGYISTNDKIVSNQTTVLASLDGKFTSLDGEFYSSYNISQVNYNGKLLEPTPPSVTRAFGDKRGDSYDVINVSAGSPYRYICTASGSGGVVGSWKGIIL
ncbi:glycosyl hydrolase family 28-related protein [Morganella morganii]|nr:hypothetical protein [Morganella morganii]EKW3937864.1 hypothetical protein [Morganella morganii]